MVPLQLEGMPGWLESLFTSEFAFAVLLGICILEGAMMLRFMPSELVVPSALALIGSSIPETVAIVAVAVVGTTIGQFLLFCLVRRAGREYVIQKRWFPLTESRLERFDGWFDRWGGIAVAASNTMLVVRGLLTIPAGLSEMDGRTFVALSALGSLSFQSILAALYLFGGYLLAL
ncbi:VTT domain-containing protein [Haloterrigena sp. SYSU A558-1]|uniref:VTT domain-containing protein n=1 Tax=Haloterrigena gelatinilytica TaxID=2741724 RepID=A0A8J8GK71_9EURY|nr:VTT domain-containing protein [Haloterrigena gelatinilytica]NUB89827.1 VTT domain-containing protein [Haloterrigena gelatinilytica]NUC74342.1 VTT domain-containing protein [Haloterrigena gelatinilytica]